MWINRSNTYVVDRMKYIRYTRRQAVPFQCWDRILYVGDNPYLVACKVDDLVIEALPDEDGEMIRWTRPAVREPDVDREEWKHVRAASPMEVKQLFSASQT